ncbi:MAG: amidohydrolase family protein [Sphaerochaetaceae bacterium]
MSTLLKNANIIDGNGEFLEKKDILINDNGIIENISNNIKVPSNVKILDINGKYIIPGLINLHVHINRRHLSRNTGVFRMGAPAVENSPDGMRMVYALKNALFELSIGITTLRDLCSVGRTASILRDSINKGIIRGPRLITCGLGIATTGGHETHRYPGAVEADGPDEVLKATRNEIKHGANFIKLMASGGIGGMPEKEHPNWAEFSIEEITAAVMGAHSHKKGVTVHAMGAEPVLNALKGGVDGIEHGTVLTEEALDIMESRGVYYVPTMSGITSVAEREEKNGNIELAKEIKEIVVFPQRESVKLAKKRNILIGAGSDTLGSVQKELLLFEECGFSRKEALQTATGNAAKILGLESTIGFIKKNFDADLLVLDKNPLEDLNNLSSVNMVFKKGQLVNSDWFLNLQ